MGNETSPGGRRVLRLAAALCALAAVVLVVVFAVADGAAALLYAAVALVFIGAMLYIGGRRAVPAD